MKIMDIIAAPWAISESRLLEIRELYFAHTRREKLDLKAWEAATGRPAGSQPDPYQVVDGVAVLDLAGVLTKADSAWNRICGMTSTATARRDLQTALEDPRVQSILLRIDSPGGTVDGTQELADAVYASRSQKPIVALADGCMCSAAYWIGAAASQVFITSDSTEVGSIGVVAAHVDISKAEETAGRKTTEITAGKFKRAASSYAPLSDTGEAVIQAQVDHIYSIFLQEVAKFRGVSVDTAASEMADGRVFLGKQAIDAGLVDGVSTLDALIADLAAGRVGENGAGVAHSKSNPTPTTMENRMKITREQLVAEAPELLNSLLDEGKAQGRSDELTRVKGCLDTSLPGYEKQALALALDGKTQPADAALAINTQQKADMNAAYAKTTTGGLQPLPGAADPVEADAKKAADEAAKKAAEEKPKDAHTIANEIRAYQTAEASKGRVLTTEQAAAELSRKA